MGLPLERRLRNLLGYRLNAAPTLLLRPVLTAARQRPSQTQENKEEGL